MLTRHDAGNYTCAIDPGERTACGAPRVSITEQEAALLSDAVRPGDCVLEIGTGLGVSTRALATRARHVITVDPDPWVGREVVPTMPINVRYALEAVADQHGLLIMGGDGAIDAVPSGEIDLVFVDGDHSADAVEKDTRLALQLGPREIWWHDGYMQSVQEGIARCGITPEVVLVDGQPTLTHLLRYLCRP